MKDGKQEEDERKTRARAGRRAWNKAHPAAVRAAQLRYTERTAARRRQLTKYERTKEDVAALLNNLDGGLRWRLAKWVWKTYGPRRD